MVERDPRGEMPNAPATPPEDASETLPPEPSESQEGSAPRGAVGRAGALPAGTVLGAYRLIDTLGAGAMGIVYLAEHVKLGRRVAIKTLRSELASNASQISRFFAEARAVNRIAHENIIEVTDFVESSDGPSYYVMELLRGATLERTLADEGALPPERAVGIAVQVASALEAVHEAGIVHRDLKPENLFLIERGGRSDFVKLLDFGIAKLMDAEQDGVKRTAAGAMLGTPQYMAPEQATGRPADRRADIYALGVMLHEMLTGAPPFEAKTIGEVILKHLGDVPEPPSKAKGIRAPVPAALDEIVRRCLEKSAAKRYQSMTDVVAALRALQGAEGWSLTPLPQASAGRAHALPRTAAAIAAAALLAGGAVAWLAFRVDRADEDGAGRTVKRPAPATVLLAFESTPSGAEVVRVKDGSHAGITPCTVEVRRADADETFELRLTGYASLRREVSLRAAASIVVALAVEAAGSAAPAPAPASAHPDKPGKGGKKKPPGSAKPPATADRGATLNPF